MRIATLCFSKTVGGMELGLLRRGADLRSHGHHVIAILPDAPELVRHADEHGIGADIITPTLPYLDLPAARKLSTVLAREEIELILVGRTRDLSTAMLAAGRDIAVVLYQQMQSGIDKRDWFHNKVFKRLDGCITITERGRTEMLEHTVMTEERIDVVPPGIDTAHWCPAAVPREQARACFELPEDAFTVGIIGGFNPGKGQREFLEGLRLAVAMEPKLAIRLHALLVGERADDAGEYVRELRQLRDALPFAGRVQFHPFRDDPREAFRALDAFVLASHSETFGMVLQEAMAMEVATVGTDSGGVPEIIVHERTGLLVPPKNPGAIARALVRLHHDAGLRNALAMAGRRFVMQAYDIMQQHARVESALAAAYDRRCRMAARTAGNADHPTA